MPTSYPSRASCNPSMYRIEFEAKQKIPKKKKKKRKKKEKKTDTKLEFAACSPWLTYLPALLLGMRSEVPAQPARFADTGFRSLAKGLPQNGQPGLVSPRHHHPGKTRAACLQRVCSGEGRVRAAPTYLCVNEHGLRPLVHRGHKPHNASARGRPTRLC